MRDLLIPLCFFAGPALLGLSVPILGANITAGSPAPGSGGLPAGCTDNTVSRADGTAGATQCSEIIIEDDGDLLLAAGDVIGFGDANVKIQESGTNDMDFYASGTDFRFTSDAGTDFFAITVSGTGNGSIDKQLTSSIGFGAPLFFDTATATVTGAPVAATGWTWTVPASKAHLFTVTGTGTVGTLDANGLNTPGTIGSGGTVNGVETDYTVADVTATDTTPVDVTGISLAIDANDVYAVTCVGTVFTALSTAGPQLGLDLPASATQRATCMQGVADTGMDNNSFTSDDGFCAALNGMTAPGAMFLIQSEVTNSTNAGNVVLRLRSETTDDVTVAAGAHCSAKKLVNN